MLHLRDKAKLFFINDIGEYMLDKITGGVAAATGIGVMLISLAIVLRVDMENRTKYSKQRLYV